MKKRYLLLLLLPIHWLVAQESGHHAQFPLRCSECHYCDKPTYNEPCLNIVPDFIREGITIHHTVNDAPAIFIIDTLKEEYGAAVFTHRLHAAMAEMMGGCVYCHHHNPPGKVRACITCHPADRSTTSPDRPSLKGAYHQLCVSCHRSWDKSWQKKSDCLSCHAKKDRTPQLSAQQMAELAARRHPAPETPQKLVFKSEYEESPLVTFFHDEHVQIFDIACARCHRNNTCLDCHADKQKGKKTALSHDNCLPCHQQAMDENCGKCHDTQVKEAFDHARTGWPLKPFHQNLPCRTCHQGQEEFTKLDPNCRSCHKTDWTMDNFNHKKTGVELDEIHQEIDCESCHLNRIFSNKPQCSECHDEKFYPAAIPGKRLTP